MSRGTGRADKTKMGEDGMAVGGERFPVHLVGSIPLTDAAEVFRTTAEILGTTINRMPDGETGVRKNWVGFQYAMMARHPQFEFAGPPVDPDVMSNETAETVDGYNMPTKLRLRPGVEPDKIEFDSLGYAEAAVQSFAEFSALKRAGKIAKDTRMLVAFPTPMAPVAFFVHPDQLFSVLPAYARAMMSELREIAAEIPHAELAIQWDIALEFALWEGLFPPPPGDWKSAILDQLSQLGDAVPADVHVGYHLCYGDRGHKHFIEPKDTANIVEVANGLSARVKRSIEWIHLPIPRSRTDVAYFAPLRNLKLKLGTELYLGLLHQSDGVDGARKRIEAAKTVVDRFGIGAECGMGRRDPGTIVDFLRLHRQLAG
jgi:methionine synthase II (cobalamin-independent)